MKKMICLVAVLAATLLLGACTTYLTTTMTYEVDTGDSISVTVDAKAGYLTRHIRSHLSLAPNAKRSVPNL